MKLNGEAINMPDLIKPRRWDRPIEADGSFGYATGRIRVREDNLMDRESYLRLADPSTESRDWNNALNEAGYPNAATIRERLHLMLEENDRFLKEVAGETGMSRILLLEHDYHHLKVMLKTWLLSVRDDNETETSDTEVSDLRSLLLTHRHLMREHSPTDVDRLATWLAAQLSQQKTSVDIPEDLAEKVKAVLAELPSDAEVAAVDRRLDRAYYEHFQELAEASEARGYRELLLDYLSIRADSANLQSMYRLRKARGVPQDLRSEWVPGGEIPLSVLQANFLKTEKEIAEVVRGTGTMVGTLASEIAFGRSEEWTRFSRDRDNLLVRLAAGSFRTPYGPEIPFGYWFARQIEVRNLRLILAATDREMDTEELEKLLRADYRRMK